jgi:trehalose-6-phosphate hydrolase
VTQPWWKKAVVYQIYPKSFQDTTGNGVGDIQGIIDRLDYLQTLGVDVIWLTPIYASPQRDNGYDISDYYSINPDYGTMETFETLVNEAHKRGIKLIMDIVVNHTSTDHAWFKHAQQSKDSPYRDFYIWKDGDADRPPNNWLSKFGGSAWEYDKTTGQYYLHLFDVTQADLNWENEAVREEVYRMMQFWLEKGVDGFRLDVINLISKDQRFSDDTLDSPTADGRKYYTDGPRIHEFLKEMHNHVFAKNPELITVGEMSSTSLANCVKYTNPNEKELNMTFSFHHLKVDYPNGEKWAYADFDFLKLKKIISDWQIGMHQGGGWNALFWCNHDQPRAVSRFGNDQEFRVESAKMLATTLHLMQGTPYIYQGEEIGMPNPNFESIDQYRDVESIHAYEMMKQKGMKESDIYKILKQKSRDNARTPMQWDSSANAGFSTGDPWIPIPEHSKTIHVEQALADPDSIFYHYKKLIQLRKDYDVIAYGSYEWILQDDPNLFVYLRTYRNDTILVVNNFYATTAEFKLPSDCELTGSSRVLISNYPDAPTQYDRLTLRPYESIAYLIRKEETL